MAPATFIFRGGAGAMAVSRDEASQTAAPTASLRDSHR